MVLILSSIAPHKFDAEQTAGHMDKNEVKLS